MGTTTKDAQYGPTTAQVAALTADLDAMVVGPITRDANGAATSAALVGGGQYTALVLSTAFPGAVDSYRCVYGSTTYTQPTVTRDASGAVINRPALVVS